MKTINFVYTPLICVICNILCFYAAPQTNFGEESNSNDNTQTQQNNGSENLETDKKIFFGDSNLNNLFLGAAVGVGGVLVTQEIINSQNNQCNCKRKRRQIQHQQQQQQQQEDQNQQKIFGFGGSSNCGCPPASVEFNPDCKVNKKIKSMQHA